MTKGKMANVGLMSEISDSFFPPVWVLIKVLPGRARGVLRKYLYGDAQSRLQNVDHLYACVLKKKKTKNKNKNKQKNTRSLYLTCMTKPTHLYTIFTEMMTHYYHFHQQNSPSSYHHRNKGSLIYLEQFQNHPIGIPKLRKMHLKTFEHSRTPCFRSIPPPGGRKHSNDKRGYIRLVHGLTKITLKK